MASTRSRGLRTERMVMTEIRTPCSSSTVSAPHVNIYSYILQYFARIRHTTPLSLLGCLYHGCSTCYEDENLTVPKTGETRKTLFTKTLKKEKALKALGYNLLVIWEHAFKQQIVDNPDLRNFVDKLDIETRLNPRESFFGGRTNACRLYYETLSDEIIRYVDFTSLYPYTNKYCRYPTGHPAIITRDFASIDEYFGIAKVCVCQKQFVILNVVKCMRKGYDF